MYRQNQPEGLELGDAQRSRSQSMSSDQPSLSGLSTFASPPPSVKPEPAYLAPSAAAQIVTSNHHFHSQDWFDENGSQPSTETALVSPASLVLVNSFLDQLLYNFLLTARSTSLASLRPAVSEVLKPRLAREAIAGADEELQEFLGGGDDEELSTFHHGQESGGDCDIELVWKRTRLRCMVYTRLGDMEEEEEDMWVERENLEDFGGRHRRFSHELGVVSPAVAIFLTSILEFIGEHALMVAGEAAYARILKSTNVKAQPMPQSGGYAERFVVEEMDMEKVAFNTTLGRLWRTWRKRIRSPTSASSRGFSYQRTHSGPFSSSASRKSSIGALDEAIAHSDLAHGPSVAEMLHKDDPASNCLPVAGQTTEECEPADVAAENDDHPRHAPKSSGHAKKRPRSMLVFPSTFIDPSTPSSTRSHSPDPFVQSNSVTRHILPRRRSRSLPTSQQPSFISADGSQPQFSTQHAAAAPTTSHETGIDHSGDRQGLVAGILAGVRASGVAAIASITNITNGAASEAPLAELERSSTVDTDIEKHGFNDDEEPQILNTTRISMEGARSPVEILQTRSRAASSAHSFKTSDTPQAKDQSQRASVARSPTARTLSDGFPSPDVSPHKEASGNVVEDSSYFAKQDLMQGETNQPAASADDQISTGGKRDSRFVFPSLLPPRSQRTSGTSTLSGRDLLPDGTLITPTTESPRLSLGHGSPALTPLPEMIEDGHETTDEASSLPSDQDAHSSSSGIPSERAQNGESQKHDSYSSSAHTHAKHSPNSSRVTDLRNDLPPRRSGSSTGKVNSERGTITPVSRRSGSSGRDNRPIPTSGSSTSQAGNKIKGLKDRHRAASDKPSLVLRTSSDGSESVVRGKHSQTISGPEDKQRSFEKLIRSDETLQYTLTPQTVRDMESPDSPRWSTTADEADSVGDHALTGGSPPRPQSGRSVVSKHTPQSSSASKPSPTGSDSISVIRRAPVGPGGSVSQPTNARRVVATARDARIEEESVRDLADFFRSTGPGKEGRIVPYGSPSRPTTVSRPAQAANAGPQAPLSSPGVSPKKAGKLPAGNHTPIISTKTEPTGSGGSRSRLQAREAAVPYGERSSDLIDFIRQGPPKDRTEGIQRNPGTVAPSTGTSNADKIQSIERAGGTRGVTQGSMGSTQDSSMAKSLRSSSNSRTGLLDTTNRPGAVAHNNTSGNPTHSEADEPPRPQRKQRRVRDPYAIDTDSDEDLDNAATSKPKRNDESLMDFLRNAPAPDSAPAGQSAFEDIQQPGNKPIPRKMSAPNIRTRFSRSGSSAGRTPAGRNYSAATSTTQTSKRTDSSNVNGATYVTNVDRERNPPARVVPRFPAVQQARSGRNDSGRSSDLADFLRNSEPPPTTQTYAPPLAKEEGGFTRMFSRRKKSAAGMVH